MLIHCNNQPVRILGSGFVAKGMEIFLQEEGISAKSIAYEQAKIDPAADRYQYLIGIADNQNLRHDITQWLSANNLNLCSWKHEKSIVSTKKIGKGAIFYPFSLTLDATISDHCFIAPYCHVGHGAFVGYGSVLLPYARMLGSTKLADFGQLQSGVTLLDKREITAVFVNVLAGSVVTKNIINTGNYGGYPARKIVDAAVKETE